MSAKVLVADDDLWILRMIATVLERRGHSVTLASDGEEALTHALVSTPDLVITDINMPRMDGWELIGAMRDSEKLVDVPVVVLSELSDDDSRVRGYQLGVGDYVAKPFRFEELDIRVANILRNTLQDKREPTLAPSGIRERASTDGVGSVGLVGTLDQVGLSSLLTLLELDRKTGVLLVSREASGTTESGKITFVKGRCHTAEIVDKETPVDAAAIYVLLGWEGGRFEFNQQSVESEDRVGMSTTRILMEAARLVDEASR